MQSVRTAGQKTLSTTITPMSATLVRYVFGLPFALIWLYALTGVNLVNYLKAALLISEFVVYAALAGIAQIAATALLIQAFRYQNFIVSTSFAKTESVQTALFGTLFFASHLSLMSWLAIVIGVVGVWLMAMPDRQKPWRFGAVCIGIASGACFGFTSLWLRKASLSLGHDVLTSAAITLFVIVTFQSMVCIAFTAISTPKEFSRILNRWPLALFVGATSALGSVGWFTAMTWQNPAIVKSVGQVEMLFTAVLTLRFFREGVSWLEWLGVCSVILSVIILVSNTA